MKSSNERLRVYFIYAKAHAKTGSKRMRVDQVVSAIAQNSLGLIDVKVKWVTNFRSNIIWLIWCLNFKRRSLLIFNKNAIDRVPPPIIKFLREKRSIKIAIDYVDRSIEGICFDHYDLHIASSFRQYYFFKEMNIKKNSVLFFPHAPDIRIRSCPISTINEPTVKQIFYYGESTNIYIPQEFLGYVDILNFDGSIDPSIFSYLGKYKFQYCIRDPLQNRSFNLFKPATKIANSLALGIPPIVSWDQDGVNEILGKDYPFIIKNYDAESFKEIFTKVSHDQKSYKQALMITKEAATRYNCRNLAINFERSIFDILSQK